MGLSVGPQRFARIPVEGEGPLADGEAKVMRSESPLDPLIAALGRAVERSRTGRYGSTREGQD